MASILIPVDESTRIAEARRAAVATAEAEELGEQASDEVAIIATEIATNLLKHARSGEVHISRLSPAGEPGIEILSIDRGPGMANFHACTIDGFSTAGTAGTGLGAISRLADVLDGYSQPERGTVLVSRKFANRNRNQKQEDWVVGGLKAAYPGESMCGDNWGLRRDGSFTSFIVADGLGHGVLAADASSAAVAAFQKGATGSPAAVLEKVHLALRSTRGAAVSITHIDQDTQRVRYAGLGNIAGVLLSGARTQFMISHNGTAGLEARRFQEFEYILPTGVTVVMHSDGLTSSWSLDPYPGLLRRHPAVIAGVLYRDFSRGRDDICVLVARYMQE